jgi:predicted transcriptional regulator of viral defense system
MKFDELVEKCQDMHCFCTGMLAAGEKLDQVRVQLNRWVKAGKLVRIHKSWYTLASPWRRTSINLFAMACSIKAGSYVSLQSALSYHGMIPEYVPETTCVTTGRPQRIQTPFGRISYRHLKRGAFTGFASETDDSQGVYMASAEKALLDLIYLTPGGAGKDYLESLRLQNLHDLSRERLLNSAACFGQANLMSIPDLLEELSLAGKVEFR